MIFSVNEAAHFQVDKPRDAERRDPEDRYEYCLCGSRFLTLDLLLEHFRLMEEFLRQKGKIEQAENLKRQRKSYDNTHKDYRDNALSHEEAARR